MIYEDKWDNPQLPLDESMRFDINPELNYTGLIKKKKDNGEEYFVEEKR